MKSTVDKQVSGHALFTTLVRLRNQAGESHYGRVQVADQLLKDITWVSDPTGGGGDEDKAITRLEEDCFADLCGLMGLPQLLELFHEKPLADWQRAKFNLKKLWAEVQAKKQATRTAKKTNFSAERSSPSSFTPPMALEDLTPAKVRKEYERVYTAVESATVKILRLEAENQELREENAALKKELARVKTGARELFKIA